MKISIFSGGRGNKNLFKAFAKTKNIHELNVIVNGLDDGASTGDIRRLMDYKVHGISDFLKTITAFSDDPIIDIMELRFPKNDTFFGRIKLISILHLFLEENIIPPFFSNLKSKPTKKQLNFIRKNLLNFVQNIYKFKEEIVDLSDYKIGNIIFASLLIKNSLDFKLSIKDFCEICNVKDNIKVIQATNFPLYLIGILKNGTLLPNEASIVLSRTTDLINKTFQVVNPLTLNQIRKISSLEISEKLQYLEALETKVEASVDTLKSLDSSELIIYGSGTPYSSILPSLEYLGIVESIATNKCPKILIANLKKETDNFLGTSSLIKDIIDFLHKSSTKNYLPEDYITHVLVSSNNDIENKIISDIEEIKINYPWITIIQDDFNDLNDIGTHDGYKVLDSIIKILNNK